MALITCPECEKQISEFAVNCPNCGFQLTQETVSKQKEEQERHSFHDSLEDGGLHDSFMKKNRLYESKIGETKCTCNACGNTWYYGKQDVLENSASTMQNFGKSMSCCTGCLPAIFIPDKKVIDLNKCPRCGSKAIEKEKVIHYV